MGAFTKAVRSQRKLRAAFDGPAGAGKSYTALRLAFSLVKAGLGSRVAVIDSEHNSASLYAGERPDEIPWEFDTLNLKQFNPDQYTHAINAAVKEGYDIVVIDGLSQAWIGEGGALDLVDQSSSKNKFTAWKDITPLQRKMVDTMIRCPAHIIATMRSKTEYVLEDVTNDKGNTSKVPRKIGVAPVQRDGLEYEFDVYGSLDWSHIMKITKTRCSVLDGGSSVKPGPAFWQPLFDWLASATPSASTERMKTDDEVAADLMKEIDKVTTLDALGEFGKLNIRAALENGTLGKADHDEIVKPHYLKRKAELTAAATPAVASEPAPTAAVPEATLAPKAAPEGEVLSRIFALISNAKTIPELTGIGATIRECLDTKQIGDAEDKIIKPHFKERKEQLTAKAEESKS